MKPLILWRQISIFVIILCVFEVNYSPFAFAQDNFIPLSTSCQTKQFGLLNIMKDAQATDTWCGVATARIAMDYVFYRGKAPAQCDLVSPIASREISVADPSQCPTDAPCQLNCCDRTTLPVPDGLTIYCERNRWPEEVFNSRGFSYSAPYSGPQDQLHPPLTWSEITDEICDEDRPYISTITPDGGTKHSIVVHGFKETSFRPHRWASTYQVLVYDPYDNTHSWDWQRFGPSGPSDYQHHGDTYKIRKLRSIYQPPHGSLTLPLNPGEPSELPQKFMPAPSTDPRDPLPKKPLSP